jgi:hypothetical protein
MPHTGAPGPSRGRHAGLLVIAGLASLLAACGQAGAPPTATISLLPDAAAGAASFVWLASCPGDGHPRQGCGALDPNVGDLQLDSDLWNLGRGVEASGSMSMSVNSGGALAIRGSLVDAPPCTSPGCLAPSADTWVRGYPSASYGLTQCHAATSAPESPELPLPMRVGAIPSDLIGTTAYSFRAAHVPYDISYDMWLNPSGTKTPCLTRGTVEIMVWTDYGNDALGPASLIVRSASVPFTVNGTTSSGASSWSMYVNNLGGNGWTSPSGGTVWVVLHRPQIVSHGVVTVDLSAVLSSVGALLQDQYGWKNFANSYWLDTIPFGLEFGSRGGAPESSGSSFFSLRLSSYCLAVDSSVTEARC